MQASILPARNAAMRTMPRGRSIYSTLRVATYQLFGQTMPSGGQFVGREQKSVTPGNGDAREPRSVGERDQVARERKAAIGKLKRFDARGRGLELGLAGKRIVFRDRPVRRRAPAAVGSLQCIGAKIDPRC